MLINLWAAWIGILLGFLAGAVIGLGFHREEWLGGYGSWRRRMMRLGHISFFGLAFVNLAHFLTVDALGLPDPSELASWLLIVGAVAMPIVCFLSAWHRPLRHLFPVPVVSLIVGVSIFIVEDLLP